MTSAPLQLRVPDAAVKPFRHMLAREAGVSWQPQASASGQPAIQQGWVQTGQGSQVQIDWMTQQCAAPRPRRAWSHLTLSWMDGPPDGVFELAGQWVAQSGLWLSTLTADEHMARVQQGVFPEPRRAQALVLGKAPDGQAFMQAVLLEVLTQVLHNASCVADGCGEEEHIHQLRVGLRRTRTVLRELRDAWQSHTDHGPWDAALRDTFACLGAQRDNDAVMQAMQPLLQAVQAPLTVWTAPEPSDLIQAVRAPAFQSVLLSLLAWAHDPASACQPWSGKQLRGVLVHRLSRLHKRVSQAGDGFHRMPLVEQHLVRKRLKRLRYLAEFAQPLWAEREVKRYLSGLQPAQDALGHHNDVAVAADKFRHEAQTDPRAWFAAGYLQAHLSDTARRARAALRDVAHRHPFWLTKQEAS